MDYEKIANLLLPGIDKDIEFYEKKYPSRNLNEKQMVTRFAPSPTGFVHMGSLYTAFISNLFAKQSNGICFLRIEDTDKKREVKNGIIGIVNDLKNFSITYDEGELYGGNYGPYIQSKRKEIYQAFAKHLLKKGLAYPCFCSEEETESVRKIQERNKDRIGYYGKWATCRNLSTKEIEKKLKEGKEFVIRLKSPGDFNNKIIHNDLIKGRIEFPENDLDIVLIKSDGLPTYHFAHLVDDHLMRTTHITRGDEWVSSLPIHIQLYTMFGFKPLQYAHIAPITKDDNGSRRKLSKRKDKEAAMSYYHEMGIPTEAVKLYLATLTNTNFEEWYNQNPDSKIKDFEFTFEKMNVSGALFDLAKLNNISKVYFSRLSGEEIYNEALKYYDEYDKFFADLLRKHKEYTINLLNVERYIAKPRKDIGAYKDIKEETWYMYDEIYCSIENKEKYKDLDKEKEYDLDLLKDYIENYFNENDTKEVWFEKIRSLGVKRGYAKDTKTYKKDPNLYKGHVGTACELIRFAATSRTRTPDLYEITKLMGKERLKKRLNNFVDYIKKVK